MLTDSFPFFPLQFVVPRVVVAALLIDGFCPLTLTLAAVLRRPASTSFVVRVLQRAWGPPNDFSSLLRNLRRKGPGPCLSPEIGPGVILFAASLGGWWFLRTSQSRFLYHCIGIYVGMFVLRRPSPVVKMHGRGDDVPRGMCLKS